MSITLTEEERAQLKDCWWPMNGDEPAVQRGKWMEQTSLGETRYVFVMEEYGREYIFVESKRDETYESETEAWRAWERRLHDSIADEVRQIRLARERIEICKERLAKLRAEHLAGEASS